MKSIDLAFRAAAMLLLSAPLAAQTFPTKPVKIVVTQAPGGSTDVNARLVAERLAPKLGQPVVIENRAGASGIPATMNVIQSEPDGHTLLWNIVGSISPPLEEKLPYDVARDLAGVSMAVSIAGVLLGSPALGVKTLPEFISMAKARPKGITYATGGVGSIPHLCFEKLREAAGFEALAIPFKSPPQGIQEVMLGRVDVYHATLVGSLPLIQSGKLIALAATGVPLRELPAVKTYTDYGFGNAACRGAQGVWVPRKTPAAVIARLNRDINQAVAELKEKFEPMGMSPWPMKPEEVDAFTTREIADMTALAVRLGLIKR